MSDAADDAIDFYLRCCSIEALTAASSVLREMSAQIVPDFSTLDPSNRLDDARADLAVRLDQVAGALESYEHRASGEAEIDAALDAVDLPPLAGHEVSLLETRTIDEWEYQLDQRRDRLARLRSAGYVAEGGIIIAHFQAMILEAEAGLAWQQARRQWAIVDPEGYAE